MSQGADKLLGMQTKLKRMESEVHRAEGEHSQLMRNLKDEFNLTDLKKAKTAGDKMAKDLDKDEKLHQEGVEELENEYEWEL